MDIGKNNRINIIAFGAVIAIIMTWSISSAYAVEANHGLVHVYSDRSCGQFIEDRKSPVRNAQNEAFLGGFLTAYNLWIQPDGDIAKKKDMQSMMLFIEKFCRENPLKDFNQAIVPLIDDLAVEKTK